MHRVNNRGIARRIMGYPTPVAERSEQKGTYAAGNAKLGDIVQGMEGLVYHEPTAGGGALNPAFSLWIMGFPPRWMAAAPSKRGAEAQEKRLRKGASAGRRRRARLASGDADPWAHGVYVRCTDVTPTGEPIYRLSMPGIPPVAKRLPPSVDGAGTIHRVGTLRGAGNAVVPQVAALFIRHFMEALDGGL